MTSGPALSLMLKLTLLSMKFVFYNSFIEIQTDKANFLLRTADNIICPCPGPKFYKRLNEPISLI